MPGNGGIGGGGSCIVNFKVWKKGGSPDKPVDRWDCDDTDGTGTITFDFPKEATGSVPGKVTVPIQKGVKVTINWS